MALLASGCADPFPHGTLVDRGLAPGRSRIVARPPWPGPIGGKGRPLRQIGSLPRELDPKVFSDHLLTLGIKSRIDDRPEGWIVWIYDENQLARAGVELKAYLASPNDPLYVASVRTAKEARRREELLEKEYRRNVRDVSEQWGPPTFRQRPLTMILVVISVIVYILQNWPGVGIYVEDALMFSSFPRNAAEYRGAPPWRWFEDIRHGELWRLVTPIFMHFRIGGIPLIHIVFNMSWLINLGTMIERRRNWRILAAVILFTAVTSNFGQFVHQTLIEHGFPAFGGMSGVVYGLFGYIWMKGQYEPEQGMVLHPNTINTMLIWLVLCMTGVLGPVANAAHLVGLVAGVLLGLARL